MKPELKNALPWKNIIVAFFATLFLAVFPFAENTQEEDQSRTQPGLGG